MFDKEVADSCQQMFGGVSTTDAVVAVGVDVHVELLVGLYQGFAIFRCVTQVYVVVSGSVNEEQLALELVCTEDGL